MGLVLLNPSTLGAVGWAGLVVPLGLHFLNLSLGHLCSVHMHVCTAFLLIP